PASPPRRWRCWSSASWSWLDRGRTAVNSRSSALRMRRRRELGLVELDQRVAQQRRGLVDGQCADLIEQPLQLLLAGAIAEREDLRHLVGLEQRPDGQEVRQQLRTRNDAAGL